VYSGIPMEYVEAFASRARSILPHGGKILWAHSMRFYAKLQHVTIRGCNITGMSKVAMLITRLN
jgi:hypothetical protein